MRFTHFTGQMEQTGPEKIKHNMKRFLVLALVVVLFAYCDSAVSFDEPGWFGDWSGEMYNDLDLDNINGPRGRVDSLQVSFIHNGDARFYVEGEWTTKFAVLDDYSAPGEGPVTIQNYNPERDLEEVTFDLIVGADGPTGHYRFLCWTNEPDAPRRNITCMRLHTGLDTSGQEIFPPKHTTFYLEPLDG